MAGIYGSTAESNKRCVCSPFLLPCFLCWTSFLYYNPAPTVVLKDVHNAIPLVPEYRNTTPIRPSLPTAVQPPILSGNAKPCTHAMFSCVAAAPIANHVLTSSAPVPVIILTSTVQLPDVSPTGRRKMVSAPPVWKVPMMWFDGSFRIAAPQSVKRGRLRVNGVLLVWQWARLLGDNDDEVEEEEEDTGSVSGVVRFAGWWMGERSDVGGTARARERVVEANAVSETRKRLGVSLVIAPGLCLRTVLVCRVVAPPFEVTMIEGMMLRRILSRMAKASTTLYSDG